MQHLRDFPGGPVVKNLPCNAEVVGSLLGQGTKIPQIGQCGKKKKKMEKKRCQEREVHNSMPSVHACMPNHFSRV